MNTNGIKGMSVISSRTKWSEFLSRYYDNGIRELTVKPNKSLKINFSDIMRYDVNLAMELEKTPDHVLCDAEDALSELLNDYKVGVHAGARIQIYNFYKKVMIGDIRSQDMNHVISSQVMVKKISEIRPRIIEAVFECARCKCLIVMPQEGNGKFIEPTYCNCNEDKKGVFRLLYNESKWEDYQRIRLQERIEDIKTGDQPQTLDAYVVNELAGMLKPGLNAKITGIMRSIQRIDKDGKKTHFDIYMDVIGLEVDNKEYDELVISQDDEKKIIEMSKDPAIYQRIVKSIAPSIYGYDEVKEAIAHQLFSGVTKQLPDGTRIRGDIHVLLVGDPGLAKSQILRYVPKLASKGIYASGKSTSGAGLTAAAVKDDFGDGRWSLEAGVMVIANNGIACIDELDKMRPEDRSAMHEALEQQSIHINKAGLMATMSCACALLGAANPKKGRFDGYIPLSEQIDLSPPLLSRFDLIFTLQDIPDIDRDTKVGEHIFKSHTAGEKIINKKYDRNTTISEDEFLAVKKEVDPLIDIELVRKYIAYARKKIFPIMTEQAHARLMEFYINMRKMSTVGEPIAVTPRQLEGLIRLSEASARVRLSKTIELADANRAIKLTSTSIRQTGVDPNTGKIDADIIACGRSRSQRERINDIATTIREYSKGGYAEKEVVLSKLVHDGYKQNTIEKDIEIMINNKEVFETAEGYKLA